MTGLFLASRDLRDTRARVAKLREADGDKEGARRARRGTRNMPTVGMRNKFPGPDITARKW